MKMRQYAEPQTTVHPMESSEPLCGKSTLKIDSSINTTTVLTNENTTWEEEKGFGQQHNDLWQE